MPGQADELIARLKSWPGINFHNDWKVITLFIGGNDLCDYCNNPGLYSPDNYISRIRTALDKLHAQVPRAFVNLVEIFDITPVASLSTPTWGLLICNTVTKWPNLKQFKTNADKNQAICSHRSGMATVRGSFKNGYGWECRGINESVVLEESSKVLCFQRSVSFEETSTIRCFVIKASSHNPCSVSSGSYIMVCSCGKDVSQHPTLKWVASEYQRKTKELIASGRYDTRSDFTVVLQPFFKSTSPPLKSDGKPDLSFFSPDCFHFSAKGQNAAGRSLWNNMIEPVGQKSEVWHLYESFQCPQTHGHAHPYFATSKNANL
ncbi:hypothetical protein CHS0354_010116 [Potamilus streckersoni]|uniref:Phospholipase B1, membrane-associated n=1 Tax=Potamilus streckersoni TaxID=2493646 RepID=A0AAE0RSI8_9BIVA|nr:hypothetical protein CHS0354_010116 [Potamilus streckersoni]